MGDGAPATRMGDFSHGACPGAEFPEELGREASRRQFLRGERHWGYDWGHQTLRWEELGLEQATWLGDARLCSLGTGRCWVSVFPHRSNGILETIVSQGCLSIKCGVLC